MSPAKKVMRLFETAERKLGRLAALVNNAGITGGFARVDVLGAEALGQVLAVNVAGTNSMLAGSGPSNGGRPRRQRGSYCKYILLGGSNGRGGRMGALRSDQGRGQHFHYRTSAGSG